MAQTDARRHARGNCRVVVGWRAVAPYRPLMLLMLVSSTASFAALGVLSLFARDELGASDTMVTVNFVVVALASMAVMLATGHVSDLVGARRVIVPASLAWLGIGYAALASVRTYPAMLAVGVVFFCAVGVPNAQLMAYARDLVDRREDTAAPTVVIALMRIVLSVGSFTGFGISGLGLAYLGARPLFRVVAVVCLGCLALSWYLLRGHNTDATAPQPVKQQSTDDRRGAQKRTDGGTRLLLILVVVMVLFSSGRIMLLSQLPILVTVSLHAPLQMTGIVLALPPLCELALMPMMAYAALRWGRGKVFLVGGAASVAYYGGLVVVTTPGQLMLLQVVYAVFGAATVIAGLDLAQRLMAGRAGTATSIYLSHENVATVNGSLVAMASVATLGHQIGFLVPGALCLIALALATWAFIRHPDSSDLRHRPPRGQHPLIPAGTP